MPTLGTINEAPRLVDLPPIPDWFEAELSDIRKVGDHPLFKIVDGQRELIFRNGEMQIKHYLQTDDQACFVRIERQYFVRKSAKTGEYKEYQTRSEAAADKDKSLFLLIEPKISTEVRMVGKPCWVIETYVAPGDISEEAWEKVRYAEYVKDGKPQMFDALGPFPREGKYIHCLDLTDKEGNAIAPSSRLIDSLKNRLREFESDHRALQERIDDDMEAAAAFEVKQIKQMTDRFYQKHGLAALSKFHNVAVGKPMAIDRSLNAYKN